MYEERKLRVDSSLHSINIGRKSIIVRQIICDHTSSGLCRYLSMAMNASKRSEQRK